MATQMPFAKKYGAVIAYAFGFFSILFFDIVSGKVGLWTVITAVSYGFIGIGGSLFFKKFKNNKYGYFTYAIIGTLIYDGITGLTIGPLMFGQTFREAFIGQIPFTISHLWGNIVTSVIISPLIYKWIVNNNNLDFGVLKNKILNTA
jgi:hypothetical protein